MSVKPLKVFAKDHFISMPTVYRLIKAGKLRAVKIGRKTFVTADDEAAFHSGLSALKTKAAA